MRVLVELFDKELIENVLGACIFKPEIVVFLCDTHDTTFFKESAIYRLFRRRGLKTQPRFYYFDATDPMAINRVLYAVVSDYPGCVFDFTGGKDLVLLVAGACFSELGLPGYYVDVPHGRFINVRGCESLAAAFEMPSFTADDIFIMAGATIQKHGHFNQSVINHAFEEDALLVFGIVFKNPKAWGRFVSWLQAFCAGTSPATLQVAGAWRQKGAAASTAILQQLQNGGVISGLRMGKSRVEFSFKSTLHRKCLMIEGVWLELYCYVAARRGGGFGDVRTSIVVEWDGVENAGGLTKNEIDVFMVRGIVPIFVSCKMSAPSALALSEIRLLSARFGGALARTVVLTAAAMGAEHRALRARAAELGIDLMDAAVLQKGLYNALWQVAARPPAAVEGPVRIQDDELYPAAASGAGRAAMVPAAGAPAGEYTANGAAGAEKQQ